MTFVEKHGLWSEEQWSAFRRIAADAKQADLGVIRFAFVSPHGLLLGKTLVTQEALHLLSRGVGAASTLLMKDLSGTTAFETYSPGAGLGMAQLQGAADMIMVPDPLTFRILPWAPHSGWVLCDLYLPNGEPMPLSTRRTMRAALDRLGEAGHEFMAGLEVEFHLLKLDPSQPAGVASQPGAPGDGPATSMINPGYQYLTELRYDEIDPLLEKIRKHLQALDLPLRTLEIEFGPSQIEMTFGPTVGMAPADLMILFRSAIKQICRREGYHATFMCRPKLPGVVSSGWHLHQSLRHPASGDNVFVTKDATDFLSPIGHAYLAGLIAHANAQTAFSTPTVNGYKRYRPYSNAPDRATWARDNRGVMVRVIGAAGDPASRLENRVGEPAANPYLYMASQIYAGLDGMARQLRAGPSADAPYQTEAPRLPRSLGEALVALRASECMNAGFGASFIDYYVRLKEAEVRRFESVVTDWEQREYFALL